MLRNITDFFFFFLINANVTAIQLKRIERGSLVHDCTRNENGYSFKQFYRVGVANMTHFARVDFSDTFRKNVTIGICFQRSCLAEGIAFRSSETYANSTLNITKF